MSGATLSNCGERSVAALPGGAEPFAGRVGWRGLPLRTNKGADSGFRRTACIHPRLRVSAGLRFAVILLSNAVDVGRDHLIHRKRSPFPYEGKDLTPPQMSIRSGRTRDFTLRDSKRVCRSPHPPRSGPPSPRGEGLNTAESGRVFE